MNGSDQLDDSNLSTEDTNSEALNTNKLLDSEKNKTENTSTYNKASFKSEMKKLGGFIKLMFSWNAIQLMLSHHPACDVYDSHVFKIGKLRLCRGCFLSYPPLYALLIIYVAWPEAKDFFLTNGLWFDNLWWFVISFGILAIFGRLLGRYSIFIKDLSKFGRGAWAGFLIIVALTQFWPFKVAALVIVLGGMTFLSFHRGKAMEKTCNECSWNSNFDSCPGWGNLANELNILVSPPNRKETEITEEERITIPQNNQQIEEIK
ncbi:MAG: hypothetical protein ACFFDW_05290 [Candidatus Thorarchaeota archaeon]